MYSTVPALGPKGPKRVDGVKLPKTSGTTLSKMAGTAAGLLGSVGGLWGSGTTTTNGLDSILCASFEDIAFDPRFPNSRTPSLLIGYHNGFQIWDLARAHQDSHTVNEIISKRWEASVSCITCVQLLDEVDRKDHFALQRPFLALAATDGKIDGLARNYLHLYSIPQGTFETVDLNLGEDDWITEIVTNGAWIAVGTATHRICLVDILTLQLVHTIQAWSDSEGGAKGPAFAMGAKWIAFQSNVPLNAEIESTIAKRNKKAVMMALSAEEEGDGSSKRRDGLSGQGGMGRDASSGNKSSSSSMSSNTSGGGMAGGNGAGGSAGQGGMGSSFSSLIGSGGQWTQKDVMALGYASMREAMYMGSQFFTSVMNSYNNPQQASDGNYYSAEGAVARDGSGQVVTRPGIVEIWSLSKIKYSAGGNARIAIFSADSSRRIERMAFDKSGMVLATASDGGQNVKVWNAAFIVSSITSSNMAIAPMYVLERGTTLGNIANMSFTEETSYVAFTTKPKGTTHLFPVSLLGFPISIHTHLPGLIPDSIPLSDPAMMAFQPPKLAAIHSTAPQNPSFSAITKLSSYPLTSSHSDQQRASHAHDKTIYIFYPNGHLIRQDLKPRAELTSTGGNAGNSGAIGGGSTAYSGGNATSASSHLSGASAQSLPPANSKLSMLVTPRYKWELGRPTQGWNQYPTFVPRGGDMLEGLASNPSDAPMKLSLTGSRGASGANGGAAGGASSVASSSAANAHPSSSSSASAQLQNQGSDSGELLSNVETQTHALDSEQLLVPLPKFSIFAYTDLPLPSLDPTKSWRSDAMYEQMAPVKLHSPGLPGSSSRSSSASPNPHNAHPYQSGHHQLAPVPLVPVVANDFGRRVDARPSGAHPPVASPAHHAPSSQAAAPAVAKGSPQKPNSNASASASPVAQPSNPAAQSSQPASSAKDAAMAPPAAAAKHNEGLAPVAAAVAPASQPPAQQSHAAAAKVPPAAAPANPSAKNSASAKEASLPAPVAAPSAAAKAPINQAPAAGGNIFDALLDDSDSKEESKESNDGSQGKSSSSSSSSSPALAAAPSASPSNAQAAAAPSAAPSANNASAPVSIPGGAKKTAAEKKKAKKGKKAGNANANQAANEGRDEAELIGSPPRASPSAAASSSLAPPARNDPHLPDDDDEYGMPPPSTSPSRSSWAQIAQQRPPSD